MTDKRYHRHTIRLPQYDYTLPGAYFVTICTEGRACLFGDVVSEEMRPNRLGEIVLACWLETPRHFENVELDAFVVMPNHVHGIILLVDHGVGAQHAAPLRMPASSRSPLPHNVAPGSFGAIVRCFKSAASMRVNILRETPGGTIWQRNCYERVIRGDLDLEATQWYILENPARWGEDPENPTVAAS